MADPAGLFVLPPKPECPETDSGLSTFFGDDQRGGKPNKLAKQAMHREHKTRAILAELGIPTENAAVSLNAAKEALLKCMPTPIDEPMTAAELFDKMSIPTLPTGRSP